MKRLSKIRRKIMTVVIIAVFFAVSAIPGFAASYQDGTYSVPVNLSGGRMGHNAIVSPCTVTVSGGKLYADIIFKRVKSPWHAPMYRYLSTSLGTVYPEVNESEMTNVFYQVPIQSLGNVQVSTLSDAMSEPKEIDYILYFDESAIPMAGGSATEGTGGNTNQATSGSEAASSTANHETNSKSESGKSESEKKSEDKEQKDENSKEEKDEGKGKESKSKKGDEAKAKKSKAAYDDAKTGEKGETKSNKLIFYIAGAIISLAVAGVGIWMLIKGKVSGKNV